MGGPKEKILPTQQFLFFYHLNFKSWNRAGSSHEQNALLRGVDLIPHLEALRGEGQPEAAASVRLGKQPRNALRVGTLVASHDVLVVEVPERLFRATHPHIG